MSEIVEQEERTHTSDADSTISNSNSTSSNYATKRRTRTTGEIKYSCGRKYLFNHETMLEHICSEHERELITLHG